MGFPAEQEYAKAICNFRNVTNFYGIRDTRGGDVPGSSDIISGIAFSPTLAHYGFTVPSVPWSYSQRAYIACGSNGWIYSSSDGTTWHGVQFESGYYDFTGCCWGDAGGDSFGMGQYVVVGSSSGPELHPGLFKDGGTYVCIYTSELGGTTGALGTNDWTVRSADEALGDISYLNRVQYCKDKYIAVGSSNYDNAIQVSLDGNTWVAKSHGLSTPANYNFSGICYGNGCYVIVGVNKDTDLPVILYSSDANTWSEATLPEVVDTPEPVELWDVTYGNGLFVAVGGPDYLDTDSRPVIVTSPDGINWTHRKAPPFYVDQVDAKGDEYALKPYSYLYTISYGNGVFLAAGRFNTAVYSTDGIVWSATDPLITIPISHDRKYIDFLSADLYMSNYGSCFGDHEFFLCTTFYASNDLQSSGPAILRSEKIQGTRIGKTIISPP